MKRIIFLVLFLGLFMSHTLGQEPNLPHVSFSTKKGTFKDPRDGKTYAYKQYGDLEWFMHNLNWDGYNGKDESTKGTVGHWGSEDPDGSKFGRFYPINSTNLCPEGWREGNRNDLSELVKAVSSEYDAPDLKDKTGNKYLYKESMKYLRGGEIKTNFDDALWEDGTGTVDSEKANKIQFNLLPMGENDGTSYLPNFGIGKRIWILGGGNQRFRNVNPETATEKFNDLKHYTTQGSGAVRCVRIPIPDVEIKTPYPTTLEVKQIVSTEKEVARHLGRMKRFDHVFTGFYLGENKTVKINLTTLNAAADGAMPQIVIGTRGQMPVVETPENKNDGQKLTIVDLKDGLNTITAPSDPRYGGGGIIYFRYVTQGDATPVGKVKIEIMADGDHVRAPHYVDGVTSDDEFVKMMSEYNTPEVIFTSDEVVVVTSRDGATANSVTTDKKLWMEHLRKLLDIEDEISGMDDNDPNPLHHRMKKGEIRHLFVQTRNVNPNASDWRVAYPGPNRYLTPFKTPTNGYSNVSWQVAHEIGHQHQQYAYLIPQAGESTVNIYSFKVAAHFDAGGQEVYVRTPDSKLEVMHRTYLKLPDDKRKYEMPNDELQTIIEGINRDELRMVPWELQFYIFGDEFFKRLHRVAREERVTNNGVSEQNDRRKVYLITRASLITGYDLRKFYNAWGIVVDDPLNQARIDKIIDDAKLPEPPRIDDLAYVSGSKFLSGEYAGWLPLSMDKGIKTSTPENWSWDEIEIDRLALKEKYCDYSSKEDDFPDPRDGKKYPIKTYGDRIWFMSNLDWDGYDGKDEATKGTVGLYPPFDAEGKVYGRYYPTNSGKAVADTWCPEGWTYASKSAFDNLIQTIQTTYELSDKESAVQCLKCGGDRDAASEGLWAQGAGSINVDKAKEVGINILPAGVWDRDKNNFDRDDDREGAKASMVSEGFFHNIFVANNDSHVWSNRNTRHSASVRCVRDKSAAKIDQTMIFPTFPQVKDTSTEFSANIIVSSKANVTYTSSDESVATVSDQGMIKPLKEGTTIITASQAGNVVYNAISSEQSLKVLKDENIIAEQTITFPSFPADIKETSAEFSAGATASSGLAITSYTSSDESVATVSTIGVIKPLKGGTTIITAIQAGNKEFLPASAEQVLTVLKADILAKDVDIEINEGIAWDKESAHKIPCDYTPSTMLLSVDESVATILLDGIEKSMHEIDISKSTAKSISFTVKTSSDEKGYTLNIIKDLKFADITATKWGNTYIVNNNEKTNGGYTFTAYKWFANGKEVSNRQYYHAGGQPSGEYKLELTTAQGVVNTCPTVLTPKAGTLKVYPVPVNAGDKISIDATDMPSEFVDGSVTIHLYGLTGYSSQDIKMTEAITQIKAPAAQGVYIVKVTSKFYEKEFKVIVK